MRPDLKGQTELCDRGGTADANVGRLGTCEAIVRGGGFLEVLVLLSGGVLALHHRRRERH